VARYAEASSVQPGQCLRFVHSGVGHAQHCPDPVTRHGVFIDAKGEQWEVDACDAHAEEATTTPPPFRLSPSIL
jgi:hypothetical protein